MTIPACPCCSTKPFARCCGPFLGGEATPRTVKQLMRSRYTAFALGGYGDYLLNSWHPDTRPALRAEALSARQQEWQGLSVISFEQQRNTGTVEFEASFTDAEGRLQKHHELSRFLRVAGKWLYVDGKYQQ